METNSGRVSLVDCLVDLGQDAKEYLVKCMKRQYCHKAARSTCRALQQLIDASIKQVTYYPGHNSLQEWEDGTLSAVSPLQHWERCDSVSLSVDVDAFFRPSPEPAQLLALPFVGLALEARQRVTRLSLSIAERFDEPRSGHSTPWLPLTLLLARLPGLRRLDLSGALPSNRLEQQMVYDALAALPCFESLSVPYCAAIHSVDSLASKLRFLRLDNDFGDGLDGPMITAIARLQRLQRLSVGAPLGDLSILGQLLGSVPPSLELLQIHACPYHQHKVNIHLSNGRVTAVEVLTAKGWDSEIDLYELEQLAGCVLLPSGAVGPQVQLFTSDRIAISDYRIRVISRQEEGDQHLCQQLRALLQRCARVEVGRAEVGVMPAAAVQQVLPLLRGARTLELALPTGGRLEVCIRVSPALDALPSQSQQQQGEQQQEEEEEQQQEPAQQGPAADPPPPPTLVGLTLDHMLTAAAVAVAAGAQTAPAGHTAAVDARAGGAAGAALAVRSGPHLVLLRGPLLAGLAWSPKALKAWVHQLAEQAAAGTVAGTGVAAHTCGAARPPQGAPPVCAYLALPSASALLLRCRSAAAAAAVQAAARAAAAALGGMAGPDHPAAQLQAVAVLAEAPAGSPQGKRLGDLVMCSVAQVAQAAWRSGALGGLGGQEERLQWLLGQWEQVCGLHAVQL